MKLIKDKCCCFTGHRFLSEKDHLWLRRRLTEEIEKLTDRGVDIFLAGGALGFDTLAAQTVLRLRDEGAPIHLVLVLPCLGQESLWPEEDAQLYREILRRADEAIYTGDMYTDDCMLERNRYLVDHSAFCLCYLTHELHSGTAYTVNYAKTHGVPVLNIADGQISFD